jgi:hypothetical protein
MTGTTSERECNANRKKDISQFILHVVLASGGMRKHRAKGSDAPSLLGSSFHHDTAN